MFFPPFSPSNSMMFDDFPCRETFPVGTVELPVEVTMTAPPMESHPWHQADLSILGKSHRDCNPVHDYPVVTYSSYVSYEIGS